MSKYLPTKRGDPDHGSWLVLRKDPSERPPAETRSTVRFVENKKNSESIKKKQSISCSEQ